ncbi:hypothetical protein LCGC14_0518750 [marine sediment metagenome]
MADQFKIRFTGQLADDILVGEIRGSLLKLGFKDSQIDSMLAGRPATIKRQLDLDQAELYQRRLRQAGLLVDIEPDDLRGDHSPGGGPRGDHSPAEAPTLAPAPAPALGAARFEAAEPAEARRHDQPTLKRLEPVEFTGTGGEYFGIWIVNIFLIILTLGFYAPWAKVRTNQYFYGHTQIDGATFQYLADPWVIFRGRLVAIVALLVWMVISEMSLYGSLVLLALFVPALPWIVIRSLKFEAVNSAYRNIRFDFKGSYGGACMVILLWPLVTLLTLLLAAPFSLYKSQAFMVNNSYFGTMPFRLKATARDYYGFFLRIIAVAIGFSVLSVVIGKLVHPVLAGVVGAIGYLALFGYFMAGLTNLVMNATVLGMHGFQSSLGKRRIVWIYLTNSLLVLLTLGFYTPWAKVRMATYRASCTAVSVHGDLNSFIAGESQQTSAMGQEIGEAFDVGVSLI